MDSLLTSEDLKPMNSLINAIYTELEEQMYRMSFRDIVYPCGGVYIYWHEKANSSPSEYIVHVNFMLDHQDSALTLLSNLNHVIYDFFTEDTPPLAAVAMSITTHRKHLKDIEEVCTDFSSTGVLFKVNSCSNIEVIRIIEGGKIYYGRNKYF